MQKEFKHTEAGQKTVTDKLFTKRLQALLGEISNLYNQVYASHPRANDIFELLLETIVKGYQNRSEELKERDLQKLKSEPDHWFLSNEIAGMSLYVDRFCGDLKTLTSKLDYFKELGINFLHLMPLFESPAGESDGGYAVSDFRKVDDRFGTLDDLKKLEDEMRRRNMYLMLDIVLNHTSHRHEWAQKAKLGHQHYQDYFYFFNNRQLPDIYDQSMPEVFPESAPGNFTYIDECRKWVMTVFHNYQWDLNYSNPHVFIEMLDTIFFYANLGVDILRIDAPAFIWKQPGTTCQNLPQAHTLLQLIKLCVQAATPGMALLGEAIVAPKEIMKYFGEGHIAGKECDFAYNATHMALQWDALATGDTRIMLEAQQELLKKPLGSSWITYTRCHDDIGLGYDDHTIAKAGYNPHGHRRFIREYYSGTYPGSPATGALFSVNDKTGDARISGSLASLCGLESALNNKNENEIETAVRKILLMQAHSFFLGGIPVIFYGDETGQINDYSYLDDPGKSYDNRWMHRPVIDWSKHQSNGNEPPAYGQVYTGTKKLLAIRKKMAAVADRKNLTWMIPHNIHVAGYIRTHENKNLFCVFNFSAQEAFLTWYAFKEHGIRPVVLHDHWTGNRFNVGQDHEHLIIAPYGFHLLEPQ